MVFASVAPSKNFVVFTLHSVENAMKLVDDSTQKQTRYIPHFGWCLCAGNYSHLLRALCVFWLLWVLWSCFECMFAPMNTMFRRVSVSRARSLSARVSATEQQCQQMGTFDFRNNLNAITICHMLTRSLQYFQAFHFHSHPLSFVVSFTISKYSGFIAITVL